MPRSRYTLEDIKEMKSLYDKGRTAIFIGSKFKCDPSSVLYHIGRTKRKTKHKVLKNQRPFLFVKSLTSKQHPLNRKNKEKNKKIKHKPGLYYKDFLKKSLTTKYVRDKEGNIISKEKVPFKLPRNIITGSKISLNPGKPLRNL